jgi:hypothetical protein
MLPPETTDVLLSVAVGVKDIGANVLSITVKLVTGDVAVSVAVPAAQILTGDEDPATVGVTVLTTILSIAGVQPLPML